MKCTYYCIRVSWSAGFSAWWYVVPHRQFHLTTCLLDDWNYCFNIASFRDTLWQRKSMCNCIFLLMWMPSASFSLCLHVCLHVCLPAWSELAVCQLSMSAVAACLLSLSVSPSVCLYIRSVSANRHDACIQYVVYIICLYVCVHSTRSVKSVSSVRHWVSTFKASVIATYT